MGEDLGKEEGEGMGAESVGLDIGGGPHPLHKIL